MFEKIEEIRQAKAKVVEGSLTIWNARLDAMVKAGFIQGAIDHLASPVEGGSNCPCNQCGCGGNVSPQQLLGEMKTAAKR